MYKNTLTMSHGENSAAANNYVANVSKILYFVHQRLVDNKMPPTHWSDLLAADIKYYEEFIRM